MKNLMTFNPALKWVDVGSFSNSLPRQFKPQSDLRKWLGEAGPDDVNVQYQGSAVKQTPTFKRKTTEKELLGLNLQNCERDR